MGNLCGKPSHTDSTSPPIHPTGSDPFSRPGRTLGSAPVPQKISSGSRIGGGAVNGGGGGGNGGNGGAGGGGNDGDRERGEREREEAKSAAARAAEARASQKPKGKLGKELERQKAQTMGDSLNEAAKEERRRREVDGMHERRNFN